MIVEDSDAQMAYAFIYEDYIKAMESRKRYEGIDEATYTIFDYQASAFRMSLRYLEIAFRAFPWRKHGF